MARVATPERGSRELTFSMVVTATTCCSVAMSRRTTFTEERATTSCEATR